MPREHLSMRKIGEVLRLRQEQGLSYGKIAAVCGIGVGTVHDYLRRAREAGLSWPLPVGMDEAALHLRLFGSSRPARKFDLPDIAHLARELRRPGVTLALLWEEYRAAQPEGVGYSYSRFCELYGEGAGRLDPRLRQVHTAGEKLFVDYAGQTIGITDRVTGEVSQAAVFVATLGASGYSFAEATASQSLPDWIGSHLRCFAFLGGVPQVVVPDNLKSGVTSPCRYEPDLNPAYAEMAAHYGVAVLPARVRKPRDKAKVENHVRCVERRILAPLRDRVFFSLAECNAAIAELLEELNSKPFQQMPDSRKVLFQELEVPELRPLPVESYSFGTWKKVRVNVDYHVAVDHCFYSVPYGLIKQQIEVRLSQRVVELFHEGRRVASHARCLRPHQHVTLAEHMPVGHREYLDWTPERLVKWAGHSGPSTSALVTKILSSFPHPQQGYRSALGLIRLGKEYGDQRLDAACQRALKFNACRYQNVKSILKNGLDQNSEKPVSALPTITAHANLRGADYYRGEQDSHGSEGVASC